MAQITRTPEETLKVLGAQIVIANCDAAAYTREIARLEQELEQAQLKLTTSVDPLEEALAQTATTALESIPPLSRENLPA
jgi:hypothetical protein